NNSNEKTTKTNYEITFPTASHGWQKQQKDFILNQDADSLTLKVKYSGVGPRTFFDAIRWDSPALSTTYSSSTPPDSDD
ncbi:hypothetical protein HY407_00535, partial [Candidatus Gottesmanbacteria bacterium]|nr:hypothetical protein [Candidatus Gottesmanbacteria bacterium]